MGSPFSLLKDLICFQTPPALSSVNFYRWEWASYMLCVSKYIMEEVWYTGQSLILSYTTGGRPHSGHFISGITAASGISAELGIPLTHRGVANSVRFLTGHSRKGGTDPLFVAENAADPDSTLVVYMGLSTLPSLASKLIHHGLPTDTPAVAIERGTTPQQRMVSEPSCLSFTFPSLFGWAAAFVCYLWE